MNLAEFIIACVERGGGVVEQRGPGVLDALMPAVLDSAGEEREITLGLTPDAMGREPRAEPATIGSPWLDELIAFASRQGTATAAHLTVDRVLRKGFREEVERTLLFSNCRLRYDECNPEVLRAYSVQFNFKVAFLSDERRERIHVIPVNLWSNQVNLPLADRLAAAVTAAEGPSGPPEAPSVTMAEAYATAQRALRRLVDDEIVQHRDRIRKRFGVEYLRVCDYYGQVVQGLDRRRAEAAEARADSLEAKREAALGERERKLRELGDKYRLRIHAGLTSARLLSQQKTFFRLLIDRGSITRTLTLAYDSLLGRLEAPGCENCCSEMTRVHVSAQGRLLCPVCAGR